MRANLRQFHFVYVTTCMVTCNYYIGLHSTDNLLDGYIGSGQRLWHSIKKHGKEFHKCEILEMFNSRKEAVDYEKFIVTWELIQQDKTCMNLAPGGEGGDKISNHPNRNQILASKNYDWAKTEEHHLKMSEALRAKTPERLLFLQAQQHHMMELRRKNGYNHSIETRKKISEHSGSSRSDVRLKISKSLTGRKNLVHSEFQKTRFQDIRNHPKTKHLILVSPIGEIHEFYGSDAINDFCKTAKLSIQRLSKFKGTNVPVLDGLGPKEKANNTIGWKLL